MALDEISKVLEVRCFYRFTVELAALASEDENRYDHRIMIQREQHLVCAGEDFCGGVESSLNCVGILPQTCDELGAIADWSTPKVREYTLIDLQTALRSCGFR
jgi:hypothetical protein